jgi:hypothetical protein
VSKTAVIDAAKVYRGMKNDNDTIPDGWTWLEGIKSCDLEPGKYKWDGKSFIPIGHGFGKPEKGRIPDDYAVFLGLKALINGEPIPPEVTEWLDWYESNIAPRHAEKLSA